MVIGTFYNYGTMNQVEPGATQVNNYYGHAPGEECSGGAGTLSPEALEHAVGAVQSYLWGASAYAVLFCECRDHRGYPNNMAQFERLIGQLASRLKLSYGCPAGTLSDAFRHNPFLGKPVDKWPELGVRERTLKLLSKFQEELPE